MRFLMLSTFESMINDFKDTKKTIDVIEDLNDKIKVPNKNINNSTKTSNKGIKKNSNNIFETSNKELKNTSNNKINYLSGNVMINSANNNKHFSTLYNTVEDGKQTEIKLTKNTDNENYSLNRKIIKNGEIIQEENKEISKDEAKNIMKECSNLAVKKAENIIKSNAELFNISNTLNSAFCSFNKVMHDFYSNRYRYGFFPYGRNIFFY